MNFKNQNILSVMTLLLLGGLALGTNGCGSGSNNGTANGGSPQQSAIGAQSSTDLTPSASDAEQNGTSAAFTPSASDTAMELSEDHKYALAYMWHEEKLAYEIYLELNKVQPAKQFINIAQNSEINHIAAVETLVQTYDINITNLKDYTINYSEEELRAMPTGVFAIDKIQALYDMLYKKGIQSKRDALEVGCMVEVTDIADLDEFIAQAGGKQDLIDTFEYLKSGSYNHYWAFDNGLKQMGVSDGCCALGIIDGVDYCHPEYPQK